MNAINKKKEFGGVLCFFSITVFAILILCGTLNSGLHMVDDHEFIRFTIEMEEDEVSIWNLIQNENRRDGTFRFRPLYYPVRVIQTAIFGTDLFGMSVMKGIEVILTCMLVYYVARKLGSSMKYSLFTTAMVLAGPQSAICWKLGTPELTATWVFALAILWILKWKETKKWGYNIGILLCMIFTTLYKENYVLLIPFIMLLYIYFSMEGKEITWKNFWLAVKENIVIEVLLAVFACYDLLMILTGVGINAPGYVGIDTSMSIWSYIKVFLNNFRLHLRIGQYGFFVFALLILLRKELWSLIKELKWQLFLAMVIILPQMVMYAKTGLEERYVIPWIYGMAYFFIIVLAKHKVLEGKKRLYYDLILGALVAVNLILVCYEASYFTYRGKGISQMFEAVMEQTTEDTKILSAFAPYDESDKTTSYWFHKQGIKDIYVYRDGECKDWYRDGKGETIPLDEIDIIMTYNFNDRHFYEEPDIDFSDFEFMEFNTMRIAVRK